ncbi:uncharacterized protein G2W53_042280 [Senna tora]|uniref:Uncharacterized protein n=1 Tax=Senna tora TaxID=362788 RepID=A0A834SGG6_9FABA|nr:uncharacterized protein G2W53_042280 [Senna tora]
MGKMSCSIKQAKLGRKEGAFYLDGQTTTPYLLGLRVRNQDKL